MDPFFIYVLRSRKDGKRYIGSTNNLARRIATHQSGRVQSTKSRRPFILEYWETYPTEREARVRERVLKTHRGYNELRRLIRGGV
jgi:putative endonuclease